MTNFGSWLDKLSYEERVIRARKIVLHEIMELSIDDILKICDSYKVQFNDVKIVL